MEDINDMREFEQRMLQRAVRRRMLLSTVSTTPPPTPPSSPPPSEVQSVEPQQLSPQRQSRRARLALLSGRINEYLKEEEVSTGHDEKSIESNCNLATKNIEQTIKQTNDLPKKKIIKTNANVPTVKKSLPNNEPLVSNISDKSLLGCKVSVAQRRALFEPNIVAPKPSKTSTTVTITLTKSTAAAADTITTTSEGKNDIVSTPPRPIPCSATTPPSRRGTRPRISPAIAAIAASSSSSSHSDLSTPKRRAWSPPCIKNVLLKKKLIDELEDDQMPNDIDTISKEMATSSPINNTNADSPADRIAKSVEPVHIMSPPPPGRLYPDLSLVEDNKNEHDTSNNEVEHQVTGCKRRSNGSSALNESTESSESVSKDDNNTDIVGAKRSRCVSNFMDSDKVNMAASQEECSPRLATTVSSSTQVCDLSTSMLSNFTSDSPMTQASTSFLYYGANGNHTVAEYLKPQSDLPSDDMAIAKQLIDNGLNSDNKQEFNDKKNINQLELDETQSTNRTSYNKKVKAPLLHTVSTYRKQQQQLRTPSKIEHSDQNDKDEKNTYSSLLQQKLQLLNEDDENDEDYELQELEMAAARARDLERTVVPEQDRIIEQATQALNICDMYRQKSSNRPTTANNFSPEHVHAERLLLIAGLKRTDAVREAQRLRVERTLLPGRITNGGRFDHLKVCGEGKTLVIESLRVPILSALISGGSNKTKYTSNEGTENLTRWPGGYRYFVCVVRAAATAHRPPMTAATRPADSVEESMSRFSLDSVHRGDDGIGYGYVEFITKKQVKSSSSRKCPVPTESEGAPIMIKGLDDGGWKITVELYGLSPTSTGEHDSYMNNCNNKEHDGPENSKSVLDKLWSTVTTPSKESKKHYTTTTACIESPGGPMAVRNTVFRLLGYFVFSDGQVDRQQFTLNKVHQSGGSASTSRGTTITPAEETVRIKMRLLEDGEQYVYENEEGEINLDYLSLGSNKYTGSLVAAAKKPLTLPSCKRLEGFLTLFDDHELRATSIFGQSQQWQRRKNIGSGSSGGTTSWRRLWFRVEVVNNIEPDIHNSDDDLSTKQQQQNDNHVWKKTIVLRYWMYPEHVEQGREPLGVIDLSLCLPKPTLKANVSAANSKLQEQPAAPAPTDLCARPNTLRLLFCRTMDDDDQDSLGDPLLLAADTVDERREWCDTMNAAVRAIGEDHERIKIAEEAQLKQKEQIQQKRRLNEQQRTSVWPTTPSGSGKSYSKKKKFYK